MTQTLSRFVIYASTMSDNLIVLNFIVLIASFDLIHFLESRQRDLKLLEDNINLAFYHGIEDLLFTVSESAISSYFNNGSDASLVDCAKGDLTVNEAVCPRRRRGKLRVSHDVQLFDLKQLQST